MRQVFEFGQLNGWPVSNLRLGPPNSIACLIHWRVAAELLCHLSHNQRQELMSLFTGNRESAQSDSKESSTATPELASESQSSLTSFPWADFTTTVGNTPSIEVIDFHFHVDRLQRQSRRSTRCSLEELLHSSKVKPRLPVRLVGGVQVFGDRTCSDVKNCCTFPSYYFGFTGLVGQFNAAQREALTAVPINRLLLESDSPHLNPLDPSQTNTPLFLGDVATLEAIVRLDHVHQMVEQINSNARSLYNLTC
ncbi:hypothetical protein ACF0H5_015812 [Mactra antiquata]